MAKANDNTLSVKITEKDQEIMDLVCYCLNQAPFNGHKIVFKLFRPEARQFPIYLEQDPNRVKLHNTRIGMWVIRKTTSTPLFAVSFKIENVQEIIKNLETFNSIDNLNVINFKFSDGYLKISVVKRKNATKGKRPFKKEDVEFPTDGEPPFQIGISKLPSIAESMLHLYNILPTAKVLATAYNILEISTCGDDITLSMGIKISSPNKLQIAEFCGKFNYLNCNGGLSLFELNTLCEDLPRTLSIYLSPEEGHEENFARISSLIDSISSINIRK